MSLKESDRHNLLHFLEDEKYEEVMAVLGSFPYVTMDIKSQGKWEVFLLNIASLLTDWLLYVWFKVFKTLHLITYFVIRFFRTMVYQIYCDGK